MNVLVIGAAGMIGRKFCESVAKRLSIGGKPVEHLTMADAITPDAPAGAPFSVRTLSADIADASAAESIVAHRPDLIYHLAAVVSGEAEADLDKGYRANLGGTQHLFEAIRQAKYQPRVVFASSIAGAFDLGQLGSHRTLNMPGLPATVGEMIASLEKVAGADYVKLIRREPDPDIQRIVDGWARRLDASRAEALGFRAETSLQEIIRAHVEGE